MSTLSKKFVSLDVLATSLALPMAWLRKQADAGAVPCLRIGRRRLFDVESVRAVLSKRAAMNVSESEPAKD